MGRLVGKIVFHRRVLYFGYLGQVQSTVHTNVANLKLNRLSPWNVVQPRLGVCWRPQLSMGMDRCLYFISVGE